MDAPPPPPPMAAMPMGMMGPQQGMGMPGGIMGQGFMPGSMQPAPPGTHQQQQQYQQMQMQHMHQMQQTMMNPGMNDAPLEFNINKNKPPMPISGNILTVILPTQVTYSLLYYPLR
uniref:(California timema) hypothetical protein n=1 Tax=Timema californicum TaxID=61474 RepID=A0A7R9JJ73_TIMCA|nr:unnamed protein product [Timema californicum]